MKNSLSIIDGCPQPRNDYIGFFQPSILGLY
jgi:hypothetical protein